MSENEIIEFLEITPDEKKTYRASKWLVDAYFLSPRYVKFMGFAKFAEMVRKEYGGKWRLVKKTGMNEGKIKGFNANYILYDERALWK